MNAFAPETCPGPSSATSLRTLHQTLNAFRHPLRIALQKLSTLDTVRIIEGKA